EDLLVYLRQRLHLAETFRQRMVRVPFDLDHPWWVADGDFDLEYHARHTALPRPGDWAQLCRLVGRLHSKAIDLSRPPWELYLIEGIDEVPDTPAGSVGLFVRMHHSSIDGVGGMEVLTALFQMSPDDAAPDPAADTWVPESAPNPWDLLARATVNNAIRPLRLARMTRRALPQLVRLPGRVRSNEVHLPRLTVPTTRFNSRVSPHRVFDSCAFSLEDIKAIKHRVEGATVNDVALAVVAGGMRRYLSDKGELPEASLVAVVPVSIRGKDGKGSEGNQVTQLFVDLHTDIADPAERLAAIAATTKEAKGSQEALGANALMQMSSVLPGALFGLALRTNARVGENFANAAMLNTQISNVPGPPFPLYCAGARMVRMCGIGPVIQGAALFHMVMSYNGEMTFSVTCDRDILPDADLYVADIRASFSELHAATVDQPASTGAVPVADEGASRRPART
ncbi:MAG: WS/DGAT/MGAT family O-acyltransferase, partial [Acidimicrobiales bacterium]